MAREEHNEICMQGGDMLAYLYDEMSAGQRDSFELHLADCISCIDGFAELSQSRYSVYEWKKLEFDPLQTPEIPIPFKEAAVPFFDKVKAVFSRFGWSSAIPAFGSLLIVGFIGFVWLGGVRDQDNLLAENAPTPSITPPPQTKQPVSDTGIEPMLKVTPVLPSTTAKKQVDEKIVPVKASNRNPVQRTSPSKTQNASQTTRTGVPTLADHDEDEDDTLRLSDLFEEIDTSR